MPGKSLNDFKKIFLEYYPEMVRLALYYIHDTDTAEDITQEVFARLWENRHGMYSIKNLKAYIQSSVKHQCLNFLQHRQVMDRYREEYINTLVHETVPTEDYLQIIQKLMDQLPVKRKRILEMSIIESKSYQDIAGELGISINTVKDHIKKAYAFLRENAQNDISATVLLLVMSKACRKIFLEQNHPFLS